MPAIKLKKVTAEYLAEKEREANKNKKGREKNRKKSLEDIFSEESKSKKNLDDVIDEPKGKKGLEDVAEELKSKDKTADSSEKEEEEVKPYNFLDVEILWDKRKRTIPAVEQRVIEWLDENLEKKEDVFIPLQALYDYYAETCQLDASNVVDIPVFNRYVRTKFGKNFGLKESSAYKGLLKEKKPSKKPKVQGETLTLKMKDIIEEIIKAAGNPRKGIRFGNLKLSIATKYPALRVDLQPKKLKVALERGIRFGQVELVKGVGMCGFYRLPGAPDHEEEEEKPKKNRKAKKEKEEKEGEEGETVATTEGKVNGSSEEKVEEQPKKTGRKRKAQAEEEEKKEDKKEGEEGKTEKEAEEGKTEGSPKIKKKKRNKKKKKDKSKDKYRGAAAKHSDPQKIEDIFPLAVTYQSDPKEASGTRIKKYITDNYGEVNMDRLKKALEKGVQRGLWEQMTGNNIGGTFRLLVDTFNPSHMLPASSVPVESGLGDNIEDWICQAIVACHEPKQASAGLIKKYIMEYHPKFNVEARPHLFKTALEKACNKGIIRQLSGIGATGSFQLVEQFFPSPTILAGELEEEGSDEEDNEDEIDEEIYVVRPTKRARGAGRIPITVLQRQKKH